MNTDSEDVMHYSEIILLSQIEGIGRKTLWRVIMEAQEHHQDTLDWKDYLGIIEKYKKRVFSRNQIDQAKQKTERVLEWTYRQGIHICGYNHENYAVEFNKFGTDRPLLYYIKGDKNILQNKKRVAIVGTRNPTKMGYENAKKYAQLLSELGFTIVSGLAKGCDTAAHKGTIKQKKKTVAILPSGFNHIYPRENQNLSREIVNLGGALISEYSPFDEVETYHFIERNRIQVMLSQSVFIIESSMKGGTCHTYQYAKKLKVPLWVPKSPTSPLTKNILSNHEGIAIESLEDIIAGIQNLKLDSMMIPI